MTLDLVGDTLAMMRTDEFAEAVTYLKRGGEGSGQEGAESRPINAIIDREAVESIEGLEPGRIQRTTITVANDEDDGILSSELDTAKDRVSLPKRYGVTAAAMGIARVVNQDQGAIVLELE